MTLEVGSLVKGTVVKIVQFGAFLRLEDGSAGLVHISEISNSYVRNVADYLKEGDSVTVKVLRMGDRGRYELSIKQCSGGGSGESDPASADAVSGTQHRNRTAPAQPDHQRKGPAAFEDQLSRFLKDSTERQLDIKRHLDSKRGRK